MKGLSILGSTGSVGMQTLEVARFNPELFRIEALAAHSNIDLLEQQVREFKPRLTAISEESKYLELKSRVGHLTQVTAGIDGVIEAAVLAEADMVVSAIVGIAGLIPTYNAIKSKKDIALANKETLVTAGRLIMSAARDCGVRILPVDSEHSAIFQSIGSNSHRSIERLILTASGGPFRQKSLEDLKNVTVHDALNHPTWKMGRKITADSATLMNKGLEVIEAKWLFDMAPEQITVCVHPQSIVHSAVEFIDGSVIAQLGLADMKLPIQYALTYPDRKPMSGKKLELFEIGTLNFFKPELEKFRCLQLAYDALKMGDSACAVLNGANEAAVGLFLEGRIGFLDIGNIIEKVLQQHKVSEPAGIKDIIELDRWSRNQVIELFETGCR